MLIPHLSYTYQPVSIPESFEEFLERKLQESRENGVRPGNEERFIRQSDGKTDFVFLYIHGYGASRAEGEAVIDDLSEYYGANTYYLRIPGHGTTPEDHKCHSFQEYLQTAEEALHMMPLLGNRLVIFGTSMGGLLTTYLAAKHPDKIHAIVLVSPFYHFENKWGMTAGFSGGIWLMNTVMGPIRDKTRLRRGKLEGYQNYWYVKEYYAALRPLGRLRWFVAHRNTFENITTPSLLLYYFKDKKNKDRSASVQAMIKRFRKFGKAKRPHPANRHVALENADHVMLSKFVNTDKELIKKNIILFLQDVESMESHESKR